MTKKFVTRALIIAGLAVASASMSYAQAPVQATTRRVAVDKESQQPFAASVVAMQQSANLNLTAQQRSQITTLSNEAAALHTERATLWSEYRAVINRPDFDDEMSATEAAPRMLRIVQINAQLNTIAARQDSQVATILNASQRSALAKMVGSAKAAM